MMIAWHQSWRRLPAQLGAAAALALLAGCAALDKPYVSSDTYVLAATRPGPPAVSVPTGAVLKVRAAALAPLAQSRAFLYRRTDERWESDYYNQFLVPPGPMLADLVRQWLADSGLLGRVTDVSSLLAPTHVVEVGVTDLHADYRPGGPARAVLGLTLTLLDNAAPPRVLLQGRYREEVPLAEPSPAGLVRAWNAALATCLDRFEKDIHESVP
jgi:ABC-type uncharacterized transport system auxiliary subunit